MSRFIQRGPNQVSIKPGILAMSADGLRRLACRMRDGDPIVLLESRTIYRDIEGNEFDSGWGVVGSAPLASHMVYFENVKNKIGGMGSYVDVFNLEEVLKTIEEHYMILCR